MRAVLFSSTMASAVAESTPAAAMGCHQSTPSALVVGTGVDPVTFRFSGGRSAD